MSWVSRRQAVLVRRPAPPGGTSTAARTLSLPPRVVPASDACHHGIHQHRWSTRHGSRGPDSRRAVAPIDVRRRSATPGSERPPDEGSLAADPVCKAGRTDREGRWLRRPRRNSSVLVAPVHAEQTGAEALGGIRVHTHSPAIVASFAANDQRVAALVPAANVPAAGLPLRVLGCAPTAV